MDENDTGVWEFVVNQIAQNSGLSVPDAQIHQYNSPHHTYFSKRFDRTVGGQRIHFASAMTLLQHNDGDDDISYLELAEFIIVKSSIPTKDLQELWSRIVLNICVSNTDDHLRNHGFIFNQDLGWRLSPAYDVNPNNHGNGLKLNINEIDNSQDLELVRSIAMNFRIKPKEADIIIANIAANVKKWRTIATRHGISRRAQEEMEPAFQIADNF